MFISSGVAATSKRSRKDARLHFRVDLCCSTLLPKLGESLALEASDHVCAVSAISRLMSTNSLHCGLGAALQRNADQLVHVPPVAQSGSTVGLRPRRLAMAGRADGRAPTQLSHAAEGPSARGRRPWATAAAVGRRRPSWPLTRDSRCARARASSQNWMPRASSSLRPRAAAAGPGARRRRSAAPRNMVCSRSCSLRRKRRISLTSQLGGQWP
jgi:hypothetical protein